MMSVNIGDITVTAREVIFSITIVSVMFVCGFFISNSIEHSVNQSMLEYRQAAQICNCPDEFIQAMNTDLGNVFVEGDFHTIDPITSDRIPGKYLSIETSWQEYRMHTRVEHYTVTDSKGRSHVRSRVVTYWSWDTYDRKSEFASKCTFSGAEFETSKFDYRLLDVDTKIVENGYHKRIVFYTRSTDFYCTIYTKLTNRTVTDNTILRPRDSIKSLYEDLTTSHAVTIFWVIWVFVTVGAVLVFVVHENYWLEDNRDEKSRPFGKKNYCSHDENMIQYMANKRRNRL